MPFFVYFEICRGARVRGLTRIILRADRAESRKVGYVGQACWARAGLRSIVVFLLIP